MCPVSIQTVTMHAKSLLLLAFPLVAHAHFILRYPTPLGPSAANQETAPCGGYSFSESSPVTNFYVDGDAVAYSSSHPDVHVLYRVVEGNKADGNGLKWDQAFPIINQFGSGDFCEPHVTVPKSYVGKQGILQVIQNAVDGMLYGCAYVKFVSGKQPSLPDLCKNGTGVTAELSSDASLQALMGGTETSGTSAPSPTSSPSSASFHGFSIVTCIVAATVALVFNMGL
ncbi:hypothetical protein Dda_6057 [Drechslerella dactyloides]|uniref:Copper acquisition factor BIM1-like domain-containing protein n=1 Tax=Drechslerella dactyloides TaxID=74499 RepID=A0AAD6IWC9_DREDA|nr:hypothetical protein Dda_6057 [Drechslerella dactyloides]